MPFYERYKLPIIIICILSGIAILFLIYYLIYLYLRENRNKQIAQENLKKGERFLSLALTGGKVYAFQFRDDIFSFDKEFYTDAGIEEAPLSTEGFRNCIHPNNIKSFNDDVINAREGKKQKNFSQIRCNFDGKGYQWWEFRYTYNKQEDIFNGLCLNIQQSKEAEQELINARQKLHIDVPAKPIIIETDPLRLTQVITNFINNASKFTQKGYIKIGYTYDMAEETVDIYVEDTGIGIPKEKQQAVFECFNKLDEFAQGTGLGLAICQVIIKRFGGEIKLQSEKGKGSRFTIALPL
ncbi:HAMP domain-containing sensor histidine kinase [Parabacteroides timonensis]|uniref:sensor histidine kinase n=1 Tax=Parabacteroides timonensis TaxID=1871013 RepID=UPI00094E93F6|nr:HAMP domain-containing sensor histidine kinase [Parabacteroides timonensis]